MSFDITNNSRNNRSQNYFIVFNGTIDDLRNVGFSLTSVTNQMRQQIGGYSLTTATITGISLKITTCTTQNIAIVGMTCSMNLGVPASLTGLGSVFPGVLATIATGGGFYSLYVINSTANYFLINNPSWSTASIFVTIIQTGLGTVMSGNYITMEMEVTEFYTV
jgi:hypothetical protein